MTLIYVNILNSKKKFFFKIVLNNLKGYFTYFTSKKSLIDVFNFFSYFELNILHVIRIVYVHVHIHVHTLMNYHERTRMFTNVYERSKIWS